MKKLEQTERLGSSAGIIFAH